MIGRSDDLSIARLDRPPAGRALAAGFQAPR